MPTTQSEANADLATAAGLIQGALAWYHDNQPSGELDLVHALLERIASRAEAIAGLTAGTLNVRPADGEPKPGG